jgi:predicted ATPase/DNA-binding SARP family transcriptional activator
MLEIKTLGGLSLSEGGRPVTDLQSRKAEALLVYLAAEGGQHSRSVLASLLWPESPQDRAMTSLRVALSALRKRLSPYLDISRSTARIHPQAEIDFDVSNLEQKLTAGQMEQALEIYRGEFLEGFHIRESLEFEDWRVWENERLRRLVVDGLHGSISRHIERGDYGRGQDLARQLLQLEPLDELAHQQYMLLLALDGQRSAALVQYEKCRQVMHDELGADPSPETQELFRQIEGGELPSSAPVIRPDHNLPAQQTSFVGREAELDQIGELIADPACRLVTLVGPGGIGKTRLSLQAAVRALRSFPDGTCFVPLGPVTGPEPLTLAVGNALQFKLHSPWATRMELSDQLLFDYLSDRSMLLVLDSFEHLIEEVGWVSQLLAHAPGINLLVTSRERLDLQGEWVLHVQGLDLPDAAPDIQESSSALELFEERARQANPDLQLTGSELEAAVRICHLVEGMPLAIEMAAAWASMLFCGEIVAEVERSLDFLATSLRDVPQRHRSLRAVFDHSWELLTEKQRELFCKLSVFCGGFELQAALEVAGASLAHLLALIDRSLLRRDSSGRFDMHPLLHQYATEQLDRSPDRRDEVHERHSRYYVAMLSSRSEDLHGARMMAARAEIRRELENVRTGADWALLHWEEDEAYQVLGALFTFYLVQGWYEGRAALEAVVRLIEESHPPQSPLLLSARAHQGFFSANLGLIDETEALAQECVEPLRGLGIEWELALCLHNLGVVAEFRGEYERAQQLLEEAIVLGEGSPGLAWPSFFLWSGYIHFLLGEYESGMEHFQRCYDLCEGLESDWGEAFAVSKMGLAADGLKRHDQAVEYHRRALAIFERTDDRAGKAYALSRMSMGKYFLEEYEEAMRLGKEGLGLFSEIGHRWGISFSLSYIGYALVGLGELEQARQFFREGLVRAREHDLAPLRLCGLAGLACVLALEGDERKALRLFKFVRDHPQTPALYVEMAERWFE